MPFLKQVQQLVTAGRKAEGRARKLKTEIEIRKQKWTQYQEDLRAAFRKENAKYQADVEKINHRGSICITIMELGTKKHYSIGFWGT